VVDVVAVVVVVPVLGAAAPDESVADGVVSDVSVPVTGASVVATVPVESVVVTVPSTPVVDGALTAAGSTPVVLFSSWVGLHATEPTTSNPMTRNLDTFFI
jgi:hypothetical protein